MRQSLEAGWDVMDSARAAIHQPSMIFLLGAVMGAMLARMCEVFR